VTPSPCAPPGRVRTIQSRFSPGALPIRPRPRWPWELGAERKPRNPAPWPRRSLKGIENPPPRPLKQVYASDVTLCIGALAWSGPVQCIVLCFDSMASVGDVYSSETEHKFRALSDDLVSLFAGSTARAKELAMIYQSLLKREALPANPTEVLEHLRKPLVELKRRLANSYAGARLAVSYDDLRNHGERWFGHDRWQRHMEAIDQHDPNVEMIVAGFSRTIPLLY